MSAGGDREELLTVEEVAEYLKLNQQTVRNMIDRRQLRAIRIGQRRVRIRQSELDRFIATGDANAPNVDESESVASDLEAALAGALRPALATAGRDLRWPRGRGSVAQSSDCDSGLVDDSPALLDEFGADAP
jgi:excisionase family DNA binding protein